MNIAFVVQYYPYQYEQFKQLIDYLKADPYYRINTCDRSKYKNKEIFSIKENRYVNVSDFSKYNYDILLYTGPGCKSLYEFSNKCFCSTIILLSHSLIGSLYDISIATPCDGKSVGLIPELWESFDSFKKRKETFEGEICYFRTKSHPIVSSVIDSKPNVKIESNTLGVIFGEKSPFDHFSKIIDDLVSKFKFSKVKIKFHPLCYGRQDLMDMFTGRGYPIEILPIEFNKYDWLDSCEYIIGGCSSLLIEEILRSKYYGLNQKFKQFPFKRRGINLRIEDYNTENWSTEELDFSTFLSYGPTYPLSEVKNVIEIVCKVG